MNPIEFNKNDDLTSLNEKCTAKSFSGNLSSAIFTLADDTFGDPLISPRLGDDYQAEIPSMLSEIQQLDAIEFPYNAGIFIPITWVHLEDSKRKEPKNSFNSTHSSPSSSVLKSEMIESALEISKGCINACTFQINACMGCDPLPESRVSLWNEEEIQSFLLGLYIFGRNMVQVRKFIECKDMKEVLSFYYGKFYRSDAYNRWADCRKTRSRKCIQGQRMFAGWRQQELISRILLGRSKDLEDTLLEATKAFNEGRSSLEELVFALKAAAGIRTLIEAVSIGQGKRDLTGFISDPNRTNHTAHPRAEIPTGKACSSLSLNDIVKFITGDFRLSKARSNDLFWEAVWPRLLATGWHSERPKNICSKNTLVFLIPGVSKFSRRKLVKGDHYFDSVTDVLNKVASDPHLLEAKIESSEGNDIAKADSLNAASNYQHPSYPLPTFDDCNADLMKFTVVDTTLVDCSAGSLKLRELRSLPFEVVGRSDVENSTKDRPMEHSSDASNGKVSSDEACIQTNIQTNQHDPIQLNDREFLAPLLKRQRLSACKQAMRSGYHKLLFSDNTDSDFKAPDDLEKESSSLHSSFGDSFHKGKPQRALFDLNQPQFPLAFDAEPIRQDLDVFPATRNQNSSADEEPSSNIRRHGTRNRPPTAKALEALESRFLSNGRIGKDVKSTRRLCGMRSRSRRSHNTDKAPLPAGPVFRATSSGIGFISSNFIIPEVTYHHASLFAEPKIKSEGKEAHGYLACFSFPDKSYIENE